MLPLLRVSDFKSNEIYLKYTYVCHDDIYTLDTIIYDFRFFYFDQRFLPSDFYSLSLFDA